MCLYIIFRCSYVAVYFAKGNLCVTIYYKNRLNNDNHNPVMKGCIKY